MSNLSWMLITYPFQGFVLLSSILWVHPRIITGRVAANKLQVHAVIIGSKKDGLCGVEKWWELRNKTDVVRRVLAYVNICIKRHRPTIKQSCGKKTSDTSASPHSLQGISFIRGKVGSSVISWLTFCSSLQKRTEHCIREEKPLGGSSQEGVFVVEKERTLAVSRLHCGKPCC